MAPAPWSGFRQDLLVRLKTTPRRRAGLSSRLSSLTLAVASPCGAAVGRPAGPLAGAVIPPRTPPRLTASTVSRGLHFHPWIFLGDIRFDLWPILYLVVGFLINDFGNLSLLNIKAFAQRRGLPVCGVLSLYVLPASTFFMSIAPNLPH